MAAPSADVTMNMWTRSCNHSQVSSSNTNTDLFQKYLVHNTRDKDFYQFLTEASNLEVLGLFFFFSIKVYSSRRLPAFNQSNFNQRCNFA